MTVIKKSKTPKYFPYLVACGLLIWLGLFVDRVFLLQTPAIINKIAVNLELAVHVIVLWAVFKIYHRSKMAFRYALLWLFVVNVCVFLADVYWDVVMLWHMSNLPNTLERNFLPALFGMLIWVGPTMFVLTKILIQYILRRQNMIKIVLVFFMINVIVMLLFLSSIHYADTMFSLDTVSQIIIFFLLTILFDLVILCLISTESKGVIIFFLGIIGLISGDLFPVYVILSHTYPLPAYGELLWLLGLLLTLVGLFIVYYSGNYNVKHWFRKDSSIKSKFILWCFGMAIISFVLFFIFAYVFSIINKTEFLGLPLFVMIYSAIVIVFAMYLGEYFEEPFKKIENNIRVLMHRGQKENFDTSFSIQEFIFLQKFIVNAFEHLEKDQNTKQLGELTAQVAHDIQSPLSSLQTIVQSTTGIPENDRITLRAAAMQIGDITNHMLNKYKNKADDSDSLRQPMLVSASLLQALSAKRYEYKELAIEFRHQFDSQANFAFINVEPIDFRRMISNLINNAADAFGDAVGNKLHFVELSLDINNEWVIITVEDNGRGIPDAVLDKIRQNEAVTAGKKDGHGLGLTQVRETLRRNLGEFEIYSGRHGTKVMLFFPKIASPHWIADEIKVVAGDTIVILDDDQSIHGAWDARLLPVVERNPDLQLKHFSDGTEAVDFIRQLSEAEKAQICLLSDYELLDQKLNGIHVIKQSGIKRSVLVTSHYADSEVRKEAANINVKILPKELVFAVSVRINKKIAPHSKVVDMVWVDDEKNWLDYLVDKYYKHLKVERYYDPVSFLEDINQYPLNTKIIMDNYYYTETSSYDLEGTMLAKKLHEMGYAKLFLLSGERFVVPEYLTLILKTDQDSLARLDTL